ncbi:MAG TPA: hypothetical protein VM266_01070 [Solirubrobacteraceae bacterium]|nr:hypothetical protein [Solirubrobacteraceae bacterium]
MTATRHFSLDVEDRPDVLPRIVTVVRRRGGDIVALSFACGDRHRPARLELAVRAEERLGARLGGYLRALVDVRDVREA